MAEPQQQHIMDGTFYDDTDSFFAISMSSEMKEASEKIMNDHASFAFQMLITPMVAPRRGDNEPLYVSDDDELPQLMNSEEVEAYEKSMSEQHFLIHQLTAERQIK